MCYSQDIQNSNALRFIFKSCWESAEIWNQIIQIRNQNKEIFLIQSKAQFWNDDFQLIGFLLLN